MSGYQPRSFSHTVLVQVNFKRCTGSGGGGRGTVTGAYAAFPATERRDAYFFTELLKHCVSQSAKRGVCLKSALKGDFILHTSLVM